jgi:hypothetical protein
MKVQILNIVFILLISLEAIAQEAPYEFDSEFPITMSMTPMIDKLELANEEKGFEMLADGNEEYNLNFLSHKIKNFSYGIAIRLEDGLPLYGSMAFLRDVSFFDVSWNYELENINFSISIFNMLNFGGSILELEPYLERQSLVAEEIYFNQEATSMIQASIQYRF